MTCSIAIVSIQGFRAESESHPNRIEVSGTATDCPSVCVVVSDSGTGVQTPEVSADVVGGNWTAVFSIANSDFIRGDFTCGSGKKIVVHARCCDDPSCVASPVTFDVLHCQAAPSCPQVGVPTANVADTCNPDGTRTVGLSATVTLDAAADPGFAQWKFDAADGPAVVLTPGTQTVTASHDYPGDGTQHTAVLEVAFPEGCQGAQVMFDVPECDAAPGCPQVGAPTAVVADTCNPDGTRTVTLGVTVTANADEEVFVQWAHDGEFGQASAVSGQQQLQTTHDYPGDGQEHQATLGVVSPEGCAGATVEFRVPECPVEPVCPAVSFTDIEVATECDANGQRGVKVTAEIAPGSTGDVAATLELLEGTVVVATLDSGTASGSTLVLEGEADLDPGDTYAARVRVTSPQGCPGASTEVEVPACDTPPPPPPDDEEDDDDNNDNEEEENDNEEEDDDEEDNTTGGGFDICSILRFLIILGVGIASVGAVLLFCPLIAAPLIPANYAMVVGGVLLGLGLLLAIGSTIAWTLLCDPGRCAWLLLFWQVAFIVGVCFIYAMFCPACVWFGLGVLVLGAALIGFIAWIRSCDPAICTIYSELLLLMIVFDLTVVMEMVLGSCVIVSNPIAAIAWGLGVAAFNLIVYAGLRRNNCLVTG